jgi:spore germination protein GerM
MKKIIVVGIIVIVVIWFFARKGAEPVVTPAEAPVTVAETEAAPVNNTAPASDEKTTLDSEVVLETTKEQTTLESKEGLTKTSEAKKAQVHYFTKGNLELCANDTAPLERSLDEKYEFAPVAALVELTKPLPQVLVDQGYASALEPGTRLMNLRVDATGNASADFNEKLNVNVDKCGVAQRRAQIVNTLKEFTGVKTVTITIGEEVWE